MQFISGKKKSSAIPLVWLLIYLSIVPMQLSNYVLCIGTDGHVGFEIAVNGRCTDAHTLDEGHTEIVITADTTGGNHCGSCLDLAIFVSLDIEPYLVSVQDALIHSPASRNYTYSIPSQWFHASNTYPSSGYSISNRPYSHISSDHHTSHLNRTPFCSL